MTWELVDGSYSLAHSEVERIPQTSVDHLLNCIVLALPENEGKDRFVGALAVFDSTNLSRIAMMLSLTDEDAWGGEEAG